MSTNQLSVAHPYTEVNPETGERDMPGPPAGTDDPPGLLRRTYPEASAAVGGETMRLGGSDARGGYMGLYARVFEGGTVSLNDEVYVIGD